MATLLKLQIAGIRSFGPNEDHCQQLKFATPLTLILGQNGCGKTTIIESIKYACTGDLPAGTNNGQGFVNDPKMSRASSTKGQIKLKMIDPKGNEVTIARVVELQQTATKPRFSTKSASIRIVSPTGNDTSVSGRCADITNECCMVMNVSQSVLNNVIFCHQENSAWPLDEGKKVKEKFDEIFDAQQYNKCTETIIKMLKEKKAKIKILEIELSYKKEKKEQVEKDRIVLQDKEAKLEKYEDEIKSKIESLEPVKRRIEEICKLEKDINRLENELVKKETATKGIIEEQNTIKRNLAFEFEGTDEELCGKIQSFENDKDKEETLIRDLEKRKNEIENKNRDISKIIEKIQTQIGQLNQQKDHHEKICLERTNLFNLSKNQMGLNDLNNFEDNEGAKNSLNQLKQVLASNQDSLDTLIEETEMEQVSIQASIDEVRGKTIKTNENINSKKTEIKACQKKIEEISGELMTLSSSDDVLSDYKKRLENINKTVSSLNNTFKETEESQKIESCRNDIQTMERNLENLEGEYKILLQNDINEGKIEHEKQEIMEKQKQVTRIKNKHSESLKQVFGDSLPEMNLKEAVLAKQKSADSLLKNLTEQINRKQKEVTTLEVQIQNQIEKINLHQKELKKNREKISEVCKGREFDEVLESCFQKKERLQIDKGQYSSVKIIYNQYIKKFEEESPCCPVCETNFSGKTSAIKKIISTLKNKLDKVPQELIRVENELQKEEAQYNKLQQLKFINDEIQILKNEKLPEFESKLNDIKTHLDTKKSELEKLKNESCEPQRILEIAKNIISDVSNFDQNQLDIKKAQRNIDLWKKDLIEVASKKSKQEVEAEIDYVKSELSELRQKIDSQTKRLNAHKERLQQLTNERTSLIEKQMKLKENLQNRPNLEAQKCELEEKVQVLKEEIEELTRSFKLLEAELKNVEENKKSAMKKNKELIEEERRKLNNQKKLVQDIEKLQSEIDVYLLNDTAKKLTSTEGSLKEHKEKENTLNETKTKILQMISEKKEDLAKNELRFRTLKSNLILREKKSQQSELEAEVADLKNVIGGHNYRTVTDEKHRLTLHRETCEKQINNLTGEKTGILDSIEELREKLAKPEHKEAHHNYMVKLYELNITEASLQDLQRYNAALEKAMMDFHTKKMIQINKTVRELWREIYRGNDIDYIEIKTNYTGTANLKKRSYDYSVVQVKKGIELEMRGRCSAGQKVLACLIIRMALAEILSTNCGILALDEPTTNLDRENIQSLSEALSRIVNARQLEKNFQLLVITHDEEFLTTLTRVQGVSHYYRVTRENDGFSVIKKEYTL